eukprot:m.491541 g.491541  ORF g.491541 m.491541 type:complete len:58 (-) comp57268_c0_seq1:1036-1209(-)
MFDRKQLLDYVLAMLERYRDVPRPFRIAGISNLFGFGRPGRVPPSSGARKPSIVAKR